MGCVLSILKGGKINGKIIIMSTKLNEMETNLSRLAWVQYTVGYDFGIEQAYKEMNDF